MPVLLIYLTAASFSNYVKQRWWYNKKVEKKIVTRKIDVLIHLVYEIIRWCMNQQAKWWSHKEDITQALPW